MKDEKALAKLIYTELAKRNAKSVTSLTSRMLENEKTDKLRFTRTPLLNSIGQELGKLMAKENWKFEKLTKLWKEGERDERLIVISALGKISSEDYEKTKQFVLSILGDITDWEICDQLALRVVAKLAVQNQKEIFSLMERWITSRNKWIRRLAAATIPPYVRAKPEESRTCLEFLDRAMQEQDRNVRKAVGWALREITKKDPESVFVFLKKWAATGDNNTKRIIKDGMKKLPEEKQSALKSLLNG